MHPDLSGPTTSETRMEVRLSGPAKMKATPMTQ
jgi:hypothetical protein